MTGFVIATQHEARALLSGTGATEVKGARIRSYTFAARGARPAGVVVISGMGKDAAAAATRHLLDAHDIDLVVNMGICGSLASTGFPPGALLTVSSAVDGDVVLADSVAQPVMCEPGAWGHLPAGRLATVTEPVFEDDRRETLSSAADIVDMEGFSVAEVARERGVCCVLLKGVSDLADQDGKQSVKRNIQAVSTALGAQVEVGLGAGTGGAVAKVLRFTRIEHTAFSLPLLFAGAWLGAGGRPPSWRVLGLIALVGVGARTLGMAANRIFDRKLDALNPRTSGRELASGTMSLTFGAGIALAGLALYLVGCAALGPVCLRLSWVPVLPLVVYSLLKRFTSLCHFGIGLCLALAPLGAFVAASGGLDFTPGIRLLTLFTFCWLSGSDIVYALQDVESDRATGVHSLPARFGERVAGLVAAWAHVMAAAAAGLLWWRLGGGVPSALALAVTVAMLVLCNLPRLSPAVRFFPISVVAGVAGAVIALLGGSG